jgi:translocation and assembly module TamB
MLSSKKGSDTSKTIQQLPLPSEQGGTQKSMVSLNLDVEAPQGIYFQNDLFRDLQARAKLKLTNTVDAPRILGKAEVIQGKLVFKDHVFQVRSGSAVFDSLTSSNPSFDLVASTEVNNIKIQLFASGKKNDIRVELSSNPPMPESDLFALLALGVTSADAKKLDAASLTAIQQGEAASLLFHSLDVSRDIEEKTGFQVGLDEAVNRQQGVSAFRMQGDVAAAPQIKIRRRLGKRLSVSAGTTVGIGTSKANQFTIDYSVNPDLSVIGVYNNFTSYSTGDIQPYPTSVGLDLKFLKRFK